MSENDFVVVLAFAVPTIQLHASTARKQDLSVDLHAGLAPKLLANEVRVVAGVDVIMVERLAHVHVNVQSVKNDGRILI